MKVFVSDTASGVRLDLDFPADMAVGDVMVLLECETDVPQSDMRLLLNGTEIQRNITLAGAGVVDGATILMQRKSAPAPAAAAAASSSSSSAAAAAAPDAFAAVLQGLAAAYQSPAQLEAQRQQREEQQLLAYRDQLRGDPYTLSIIKQNDPELAAAVAGEDFAKFREVVMSRHRAKAEREAERRARRARLAANPFDVEAQRALEEEIRQENVEALRQQAIEHMPESFGSVIMLYVDVVVNGHPLKAFVDSGAQMTIMSAACADRVGLLRLVDKRFAGTAVGVGTQSILGRVHMYELVLGGSHLPTSFSILEKQDIDLLIGLDMLKRHQCMIDLKDMVLRIGTTGAVCPFLAEADLPACAKRKPQAPSGEGTTFPDEHISRLMGLGNFTRERAIEALAVSSGDTEAAAAYLFSMKTD